MVWSLGGETPVGNPHVPKSPRAKQKFVRSSSAANPQTIGACNKPVVPRAGKKMGKNLMVWSLEKKTPSENPHVQKSPLAKQKVHLEVPSVPKGPIPKRHLAPLPLEPQTPTLRALKPPCKKPRKSGKKISGPLWVRGCPVKNTEIRVIFYAPPPPSERWG